MTNLLLLLLLLISMQGVYKCIKLYRSTRCCNILVITVFSPRSVIFSIIIIIINRLYAKYLELYKITL
jgi:hypothetical protein